MTRLRIAENVMLAPYTTIGVGGPARYFAEAECEEELLEGLEFSARRNLPLLVVGGGSNLLVSDSGYPGLALRVGLKGILPDPDDSAVLTVSAGEEWDSVIGHCVSRKLAGIECLSGIPGRTGATPVQNVGAYGQEVSETILSVRAIDRESGETLELGPRECEFGYRTSIFATERRDRYVLTAVTFGLRPGGKATLRYPDLEHHFAERSAYPSLAEVRAAVIDIRTAKGMVLSAGEPGTAGSFFKNPVLDETAVQAVEDSGRRRGVLSTDERVPRFPTPEGRFKLAAAWLVEHAGFRKGYTRGRAAISTKHALALVNRGNSNASELMALAEEIYSRVHETFGIELQLEPSVVGFPTPVFSGRPGDTLRDAPQPAPSE